MFPGEQGSLSHPSREQGGSQARRPTQSLLLLFSATRCCFSFLGRRKGGESADFLWQPGHDRPLTHLGQHQLLRDRPGSLASSRSWKQGSLWQPLARMLSRGVRSRRHPHSMAVALLLGPVTRIEERLEWHWDVNFLRMAYKPQPGSWTVPLGAGCPNPLTSDRLDCARRQACGEEKINKSRSDNNNNGNSELCKSSVNTNTRCLFVALIYPHTEQRSPSAGS